MKRLFYFLIVMSCTLWSCGKSDSDIDDPNNPDNPDNPANVTLDISTTDLTFEASGGQKKFTIYCNSDWTITNNSTWCKTDVTNGNGNKTIIVTANPYSETEDQNTNLTIKAGDKTKVLTVTQKHGDAIILTKDKFDIPQEGDNITIEVKSNIEYQVSIPSQFQSWIKEAVKSKAITTKSFNFTISANENFDKREGYIVFSSNSLKDTVCIYQAQKNQLILTEDTYNIPAEEKDITVELKTNVDYDVTIPSDAKSWISQVSTKAIRTDQLKFHIAANNESNNRSAKIVIKDKNSDLSEVLEIVQMQKEVALQWEIKATVKPIEEATTINLTFNNPKPNYIDWGDGNISKNITSSQISHNYQIGRSYSLVIKGQGELTELYFSKKQLTFLNVSKCTKLDRLLCNENQLTSLDVSGCISLTQLVCGRNQLTSLDVSKCTKLMTLDLGENKLTSLDISKNKALTHLDCCWNNLTGALNISKYTALNTLKCFTNQLTTLDVSGCSVLTYLECTDNKLTSLDISRCVAIEILHGGYNQFSTSAMNKIYTDLPKREKQSTIYMPNSPYYGDISIAKNKGWTVYTGR